MLKFTLHISGRYTVNYFARNVDNVLIGWRFGAHALGFYKKAYDLFALSAGQLVLQTSNVAVSALSRVKDDHARFIRNLLAAIGVMAFIGMGIAGVLTLAGPDVIRILLGNNWDEAGRLFVFFAPGIGIMMVHGTHGWIHVSIGRADRWLMWGIVEWMVTCLLFLVCLHWGPEGIAVAWCVSFWILALPAMWFAGRPIGLGVGPVLAAVWRYIAASLAAGLATGTFLRLFPAFLRLRGLGASACRLAVISACFGVLYVAAIVLLHGGTGPLRRIVGLLREMLPGPAASTPANSTALEEPARP
jgi:PST family polysaccharide transporter